MINLKKTLFAGVFLAAFNVSADEQVQRPVPAHLADALASVSAASAKQCDQVKSLDSLSKTPEFLDYVAFMVMLNAGEELDQNEDDVLQSVVDAVCAS
ncbi:hypothetical protein ACFFK7_09995 [Pseudoalteromonas xiamenensis]|uniref:hypothetical protein n=1 Tax=Pseudoalteromonas xiamenensis TaxID=882626 RepID=UPI0035EA7EC7